MPGTIRFGRDGERELEFQLVGDYGETVTIRELPRYSDAKQYMISSSTNPLGEAMYVTFSLTPDYYKTDAEFNRIFEHECRQAFEIYKRGLKGAIWKKKGWQEKFDGPYGEKMLVSFNRYTGEFTVTWRTAYSDYVIASVSKQVPASAIEAGSDELVNAVERINQRLRREYIRYIETFDYGTRQRLPFAGITDEQREKMERALRKAVENG